MSEYEIDSQLQELLDTLRPVPERNPDAKYRSRRRFNSDLDAFFPVGAPQRAAISASVSRPVVAVAPPAPVAQRSARPAPRPNQWYQRPLFAYLAIVALMLVAVFGGGAVTVMAAGSALPGDVLYPVKLNTEQAQLNLTSNPERQAELYLQFAQHRLEEMNALTALGQFDEIEPLAMYFNYNLSLAEGKARRLAERDPVRALQLQSQVSLSLGQLKQTFELAISKAPPAMQATLQNALEQALQLNPPADDAKPGNRGGNAGNNNPNRNNSNANSNANGAPGASVNNNGNDNSNANPNSDKDKDKDKDKEEKDKDKEEKDKDKEEKIK